MTTPTREAATRALRAVAEGHPAAVRLCVEALAVLLDEPAVRDDAPVSAAEGDDQAAGEA